MGVVFYTVYYQAVSGSLKMTLGNITTTSVTVTNLSPATEYMMTVVAENGVPGDEANRSVSITVTTESVFTCTLAYYFFFLYIYVTSICKSTISNVHTHTFTCSAFIAASSTPLIVGVVVGVSSLLAALLFVLLM